MNIESKKSPLDKLMNKVSKNEQAQIEGITAAKHRENFVSSINETDLDLSLIDSNPYQPRKSFNQEKINDLAEAIKINGLIAPIAVRKIEDRFQIIAGERRFRAVKSLNHSTIKAIIFNADDEATALMALSENIDREGLSDYEVAQAIIKIEHLFKKKTELSRYTGKMRSDIYRYLSYKNLPIWIINKLDTNPHLINRNNSQLLVSFFSSLACPEENYKKHVISALNMIEQNALTQTMLLPKIKRLIKEDGNPRRKTENAISKTYTLKGKKVGQFSFDDKKIIINLKSEILDEDLATSIYQLIAEKLLEYKTVDL